MLHNAEITQVLLNVHAHIKKSFDWVNRASLQFQRFHDLVNIFRDFHFCILAVGERKLNVFSPVMIEIYETGIKPKR